MLRYRLYKKSFVRRANLINAIKNIANSAGPPIQFIVILPCTIYDLVGAHLDLSWGLINRSADRRSHVTLLELAIFLAERATRKTAVQEEAIAVVSLQPILFPDITAKLTPQHSAQAAIARETVADKIFSERGAILLSTGSIQQGRVVGVAGCTDKR